MINFAFTKKNNNKKTKNSNQCLNKANKSALKKKISNNFSSACISSFQMDSISPTKTKQNQMWKKKQNKEQQ